MSGKTPRAAEMVREGGVINGKLREEEERERREKGETRDAALNVRLLVCLCVSRYVWTVHRRPEGPVTCVFVLLLCGERNL